MANKNSRYILYATSLAVLAAILTFVYLNSLRATEVRKVSEVLKTYENEAEVVVAKKNISAGVVVSEDDIDIVNMLGAYIVPQAVLEASDVVGQTALVDIYEGEQIAEGRFGSLENVQMASRTISKGKIALAIGVDEISGVSGGIRPGDRVNVYVTYEESQQTDLLFQGVLVRGVGGSYPYGGSPPSTTKSSGSGFGSSDAQSSNSQPTTVVLEMTEDQAPILTFASERGSIRLALLPAKGE